MIKINPAPTFELDVRLTVPGQAEPAVIPMTLAYMTAERTAAWFKDRANTRTDEAMADIVKGWGMRDGQAVPAVQDDAGQEVPFSAEALAQLVKNYQPATQDILNEWQRGLRESRIKN